MVFSTVFLFPSSCSNLVLLRSYKPLGVYKLLGHSYWCGGVDWTSPTVLAFSYIYRAFGFLSSSLYYIYYDLTSYWKYTLFFIFY